MSDDGGSPGVDRHLLDVEFAGCMRFTCPVLSSHEHRKMVIEEERVENDDDRTIQKFEEEAKDDKSMRSWYLAYIMDTNDEALAKVISAQKGEFETGYEKGGLTRELVMLAKSLGVKELIVVVDNMHAPTFNQSKERCPCLFETLDAVEIPAQDSNSPLRFDEVIGSKRILFIRPSGYNVKKDVMILSLAGSPGSNFMTTVDKSRCPCLFETLDAVEIPAQDSNGPLRYMTNIMDANEEDCAKEEEHAKGKTVVVGRAQLETEATGFTILDATVPLFVRASRTICLSVDLSESVSSLKMRILQAVGVPVALQRLTVRGKPLFEEGLTLRQCGVEPLSTVFMCIPLLGGAQVLGPEAQPYPRAELEKFYRVHKMWWDLNEVGIDRVTWWQNLDANKFWTTEMIEDERYRDIEFWATCLAIEFSSVEAIGITMPVSHAPHRVYCRREVGAFKVLNDLGRWTGDSLTAPLTLHVSSKNAMREEALAFGVTIVFD